MATTTTEASLIRIADHLKEVEKHLAKIANNSEKSSTG